MQVDQRRGVWLAVTCYTIWGLFPLYWRALHIMPALDLVAHRIVWSLAFLLVLQTIRRRWGWLTRGAELRRALLPSLGAALTLSCNWGIFIWGVNVDRVVETSLGYFINPLVSVALGVIVLREPMRRWQGVAIGIALLGVLWAAWGYGRLPWVALGLALSFGVYGLLKKRARLAPLDGLALETALMLLPAAGLLSYNALYGHHDFVGLPRGQVPLLLSTGVVTVLPLWIFAEAARHLPLSLLGLMQYIAPSLQLAIGLFVVREPFDRNQLIGFVAIWIALLIYWIEGLQLRKRSVA